MKQAAILFLAAAAVAFPLAIPGHAQDSAGGPPQHEGRGGIEMPPGSRQVLGTVTVVTADGLTVRTVDGEDYKITAGPNTRVTHEREPAKLTDIKPGDGIMAFGQADAADPKILHSVFLGYQNAAEVKERMANFGKTWVAGRVTAISGAALTLDVRQPGETASKSMTITADENTSFKRGRESITMADIQTGDMVMGRGQVKAGAFVPATLQIRTPGGHHPHGGPGIGPGPGTGPGAGASPPPQ